jgi:hypothetical protein
MAAVWIGHFRVFPLAKQMHLAACVRRHLFNRGNLLPFGHENQLGCARHGLVEPARRVSRWIDITLRQQALHGWIDAAAIHRKEARGAEFDRASCVFAG